MQWQMSLNGVWHKTNLHDTVLQSNSKYVTPYYNRIQNLAYQLLRKQSQITTAICTHVYVFQKNNDLLFVTLDLKVHKPTAVSHSAQTMLYLRS